MRIFSFLSRLASQSPKLQWFPAEAFHSSSLNVSKKLGCISLSDRTLHQSRSSREFSTAQQELKTAPSEHVSAIVDEISNLTLLEVCDLTELVRQRLGIEEMPTMGVMMPGMSFQGPSAKGPGAAKVEEKAEKTSFDLKLESFEAAAKIKIIKEVRTFTDLGLKEAKDLVEKAPTILKKGVLKEEAEKIIAKLKEVGAKVVME
ncbi:hypothetical protein H6P81_003984 [Aristolochia fimbriata]|uniref:Uncharacterized protein n=1 Tax=Aristolochia fimbriata TaxID=158543 RepID=A0AAV7FGZ8_ARIFI|nr:hypothetical protein H6P81_003984 [Aristolochia fimbriata]